MSGTCAKCHKEVARGGVYRNNDPYGTRRKLNLPRSEMQFYCWGCYDHDEDMADRDETLKLVQERGLCGFIEPWIGHCLNTTPCEKHGNMKCWCGAQAVEGCHLTGVLVCGAPLCQKHTNDCKAHSR